MPSRPPKGAPANSGAAPACVVAIGGFDPSCGAGIGADLRTLDACGVLPAAVTTATTVQSGTGVRSFRATAARDVASQLEEVVSALSPRAWKVGQLPTSGCVDVVARAWSRHGGRRRYLVLDPVAAASGGGALVRTGATARMRELLMPLASVVTVNLSEATVLSGIVADDESSMLAAARVLMLSGPRAVVVKGGHLSSEPFDLLVERGGVTRFAGKRVFRGRVPVDMHGSGCAFASALAASLAQGDSIATSVRRARRHVRSLLEKSVRVEGDAFLRAPSGHR